VVSMWCRMMRGNMYFGCSGSSTQRCFRDCADYFQSVAPAGYTAIYQMMASTSFVNKPHHGAGTIQPVTVLVVVAGANSRIHHHVAAESKSVDEG